MLEEQMDEEKIKDWLCNDGVGVLAYRRDTGEPYVKRVLDRICYGEDAVGEFVLATRRVYQTSLYLAFYTVTDGGEEARKPMVSGCVKLPERLPKGTKVEIGLTADSMDAEKLEWRVKHWTDCLERVIRKNYSVYSA